MGFNVCLIRVEGKSPEQIHEEYGVRATGEFFELPEYPVQGVALPDGSYQLFINDNELERADPEPWQMLERIDRPTRQVEPPPPAKPRRRGLLGWLGLR